MNLGPAKSNTKTKTCTTCSFVFTNFGLHHYCYHRTTCRFFFSAFGLHKYCYRQVTCPTPLSRFLADTNIAIAATFGLYQCCYHYVIYTPVSTDFGLYLHRYHCITRLPCFRDLKPISTSPLMCRSLAYTNIAISV